VQRFLGQSAVVTGGASGIGRAVAARLEREGARVCVWDRRFLTLAAADDGRLHISVDVTDAQAVNLAAKTTLDWSGRIDILVNSAGITGPNAATWEYGLEDWRRVIDVNLTGLFHCCRSIVPAMRAEGYGRVVNVASIAGKEGNPNASAYSASKAGVIALTKSLGKELAGDGVVVNAVTPTAIKTDLFDQMKPSFIDYMLSRIPMGRFGEVDEAASLICWLASRECSFSTAAVFDLSGGRATY